MFAVISQSLFYLHMGILDQQGLARQSFLDPLVVYCLASLWSISMVSIIQQQTITEKVPQIMSSSLSLLFLSLS